LTVSNALAQPASSSIEKPVDDADYQRILEYYNYDPGMPSDPEFYGEWPWRGPYYYRDWMCQSIVDLRRGIDYLESRPDIDPDRIAVFGGSLGGWIGSILAAVEPRIKTAILSVPATEDGMAQTPPGRIINSSNFFPRYKDLSLLMVLAKNDVPLRNARAKEFFDLVQVKKEVVEYNESHFLDPQKYNKDILEWLKENL
jgi:pimeloyl-ACP methyl ester carboxylesterase